MDGKMSLYASKNSINDNDCSATPAKCFFMLRNNLSISFRILNKFFLYFSFYLTYLACSLKRGLSRSIFNHYCPNVIPVAV